MAGKDMIEHLEKLMQLATEFVQNQKGSWDHDAWLAFLEAAKKEGYELSHEMNDQLGELLEAMKGVYHTAESGGPEKFLADLGKRSTDFVKKSKGAWDNIGWEKFLKSVEKSGMKFSNEAKTYVGGVLEGAKKLYKLSPETAAPKEPAKKKEPKPKKTAAPKAKEKPKAKAPKKSAS